MLGQRLLDIAGASPYYFIKINPEVGISGLLPNCLWEGWINEFPENPVVSVQPVSDAGYGLGAQHGTERIPSPALGGVLSASPGHREEVHPWR